MTQQGPNIPILDMSLFEHSPNAFADLLGSAFQEHGFIGVTNHGVSPETIQKAYRVFKQFFALSEAKKRAYVMEGAAGQRGYTPYGVEVAKESEHCDLKEFWQVGREIDRSHPLANIMQKNLWPAEIDNFKNDAYAMFTALDMLGRKILSAIALYLGQEASYFEDIVAMGNGILRAIHYPPVEDHLGPSIRAGQHEDINFITLLVGSNEPGLEILSRKGEWIPVTTIEGTIVCNIADMMQRLTNHVLPSTTHRVVNPEAAKAKSSRYSIPFFMHPRPDFAIKTLPTCVSETNANRYPEPIVTNDYLNERLREIGLM